MTPCTRKTEELIVKYIYFYMPAESYGALSRAGMRRMCINTYSVSFSVKHVDSKATEQMNNTSAAWEHLIQTKISVFSKAWNHTTAVLLSSIHDSTPLLD